MRRGAVVRTVRPSSGSAPARVPASSSASADPDNGHATDSHPWPIPQPDGHTWPVDDLGAVASGLRVDAAAARVATAFTEAGIDCILLKGSTHAFLARPGEHRSYVDVDLLIDPATEAAAQAVLAGLGYRDLTAGTVASERVGYGTTWVREGRPPVDLHRTMPMTARAEADVWAVLRAEAVGHEVAGVACRALSVRGRFLQIALHAAKSGTAVLSPSWDLSRAVLVGDAPWTEAHRLAVELGAEVPFAAGLRAIPEGGAVADALGLAARFSLDLELRSRGRPGPARSVGRFLSTPGVRPRLRLVRRALVPSPASLRLSTPIARRGDVGLAVAYVRRPLVVAWRLIGAAPSVVAALRRRRQARSRSSEGVRGDGGGGS